MSTSRPLHHVLSYEPIEDPKKGNLQYEPITTLGKLGDDQGGSFFGLL